jgi:sugar phosphate permease
MVSNSSVATIPSIPSRTRYWVLLIAFLATMIHYLDRACLSVAAPGMSKDLNLSRMQMGYVFVAFDLAYAIFGIPVSWLGDRTGQRKLVTSIVVVWSILTILTGFAPGLIALLVIRFAFGAAESGAFPTLSRALARWFPRGERARANGVLWMGGRLGGSLAPALAVLCIAYFGWRAMFVIFGAASAAWCAVFWYWYRDEPGEHASVNALELRHIRGDELPQGSGVAAGTTPWRQILTSGNLWALYAMYFCSSYGFQFFISWMPTFLMKDHGLSLQKSGLYSAFPLGAGTLGCLAGGALADWLGPAIGSVKWARTTSFCR